MRKRIIAILIMALIASWCNSQDVPAEITEILNGYLDNPTAEYGFLFAKKWLHLSDSIQLTDVKVGRPIQEFTVKYPVLDTCSDTIPFYQIIKATNYWLVPVLIGDKPLYELELSKSTGKWQFSKIRDLPSGNMWDQLSSVYSESTETNPVLVVDGLSKYFYFKQKGPRKIYYIRPGYKNDSLEMITPGSLRALDDSKKLIKHWKEQGKGSNNSLDNLLKRNSEQNHEVNEHFPLQ